MPAPERHGRAVYFAIALLSMGYGLWPRDATGAEGRAAAVVAAPDSSAPIAVPAEPGAKPPPGESTPGPRPPGSLGKPGESPGEPAAKPGESPGKTAEGVKPSDGSKPVTRPSKPPAPPKPEELAVRPDEAGQVRFGFVGQPWPAILEWIAEISGMSLDWQELPGDYLNLVTRRTYTVREARDVINRHLLARGYTMLVRGEFLTVANVKKLDPSLVPRVEPQELDGRDPYEFAKVSFPLDSLVAEATVEELKPMLSPNGKLTAFSATNRVEAMDAVVNLREIRALLEAEQSPGGQQRSVREFPLQYARAEDVREILHTLLGIESKQAGRGVPGMPQLAMDPAQQQQAAMMMARGMSQSGEHAPQPGVAHPPKTKPLVTLAVNARKNSLLVHAPPDTMAVIAQAVEALDVPPDRARSLPSNVLRMQVYRVAGIDPEPLVKTLEEIGNLDPTTRLQVDKKNKAIIAYASLADHVTIRAVVEKLGGSERKFEVIRLRRLASDYVAGTIEFMMGAGPKKDKSRRNPWGFGSSSGSGQEQAAEHPNEFRVDADVEHNRLLLWANEIELAEVENLLVKLGEIPAKGTTAGTVRVIHTAGEKETQQLLERIRRTWPTVAPNPLALPSSQAAPPDDEPETEPPPDAGAPGELPPPRASSTKGAAWQAAAPLVRFAQLRREDGAGEPPSDRAGRAARSLPPVRIAEGPDGQLILSSEDPEALDLLEETVTQLLPPRKTYKVFRLKYAWAYGVSLNLQEFFKEEEKKSSRWTPWWFDSGSGQDDKEDEGRTRLSKRRKLRFISDSDTNSILVEGADPAQLKTIEELVQLYDQPPPTDSQSVRKTEVFHLQYSKAKIVAETVKEVYRDLLSANDKALIAGKQPDRDSGRSFSIIMNDAEKTEQKTPKFKGLLSIGVDELSNTLVVSAPAYLFDQVTKMVKDLDEAAQPTLTVQAVKVGSGVSAGRLQEVLAEVMGDGSSSHRAPAERRPPRRTAAQSAPPAKAAPGAHQPKPNQPSSHSPGK